MVLMILLKSRYTTFTVLPLLTVIVNSSQEAMKLIRKDLTSLNPCWLFLITFLSFMRSWSHLLLSISRNWAVDDWLALHLFSVLTKMEVILWSSKTYSFYFSKRIEWPCNDWMPSPWFYELMSLQFVKDSLVFSFSLVSAALFPHTLLAGSGTVEVWGQAFANENQEKR